MPRLAAVLASNAFIIGALLRPALKTYNLAGAVKGGGIKALSIAFLLFFSSSFLSLETIRERKGRKSYSKALKVRA